MNKIESKLSRSSAAAEKSRIIQLRRRAGERRQLFLFEKSTHELHDELSRSMTKEREKNLFFLLLVNIESEKLKI